ncbi:MAG: BatA domain-containing protein, partial [Planctomycetota bacterium]
MTFHHPSVWLLVLLLIVPLAWWRWVSARRRPAIVFSSVAALRATGATWAVRARWILPVLRTAALVLLVVCLARPRKPDERSRVFTEGIAIQLVLDRSGTMGALDFEIGGRPADRLTAVKDVVEVFVAGDDQLPGRPDDLIG